MGCVFCEIVAGRAPAEVVHETPLTTAFMDGLRQPRDVAHVLVVPRAHIENIYGIDEATGADLFASHVLVARAVKSAFGPDGITTWSSNERGARQEVPHYHLNVYPRRIDEPFPPPLRQPETLLPLEFLAPAADRIRAAIAEIRASGALRSEAGSR